MTKPPIVCFLYLALLSLATIALADEVDCGHETWNALRANRQNLTYLNDVRAPAWVRESELRGTFSILQTCILTLIACVYTALHLNVPEKAGFWPVFRTKLIWILFALFGPELVLFEALSQFCMAWRLSKDLRKLKHQSSSFSKGKDVRITRVTITFVWRDLHN